MNLEEVRQYVVAIISFIFSAYILTIVKSWLISFLKEKKAEFASKFIQQFGWPFTIFLSLIVSARFIDISFIPEKYLFLGFFIVISFYSLKIIQLFLDLILKPKDEEFAMIVKFIRNSISWVIWFLVLVLIFKNLGFNVSTLLTSFGVIGIIIAFTVQNILLDVFSYFTIYLDKPFKVNDFIIVGTESGTVKKIGIKSTRVLSLKGEELIFSNRKLLDNVIHNYRRMTKRRKTFEIRVSQDTSFDNLKLLLEELKKILKKEELVEIERVHFRDIENAFFVFEAVYCVKSNEYNVYMDVQENINFKVKEFLEKNNIKLI
ncbi:MAG: mechanosensitive ion channel [Candidatus Pacebacteria bacterium]|nr:mechanosensitive ion channel [Candidatus Paceibacterota bacterium]